MGGLPAFRRITRALAGFALITGFAATQAQAFDAFDGRLQAHGYFEAQLRTINANFSEDWDVTQWYLIFNLELEFDIAPDGIGPFDLLQAYVRLEGRYDCIYSQGCGMFRSINAFGNDSKSLPRRLNGGHDQLGTGVFPRDVAIASNGTREGKETDPNSPNYGRDLRNGTRVFTGERLSGATTDPVSLNDVRGFGGLFDLAGADGIVGVPTADCNPIDGARLNPLKGFGTSGCDIYSGGATNSQLRFKDGPNGLGDPLDVPKPFLDLGIDDPAQYLLANFESFRFGQIDARGGSGNGRPTQILGPWLPKNRTNPIATLADRVNPFDSTRTSPIIRAATFNNTFNKEFDRRFGRNLTALIIANPGVPPDTLVPQARSLSIVQATQAASDAMLPPEQGKTPVQNSLGLFFGRDQTLLRRDPNISSGRLFSSVPFPSGGGARAYRPIPFTDEGDVGLATPVARGIYYPTEGLRESLRSGDLEPTWLLNLSQTNRAWNRGFSQRNEKELKEAYLDIEMLDSRLWMRIGRQQIVWGKTELFRTTDQFNPTDVGLASLPSLEESRIALWSFRGIYSLYEVGPLEDVRVELAFNYDDVSPADLGACGEPYVVNLVCSANFGAFAHGLTGIGIAGVDIPDAPWTDAKGWELGARLEFRWDRFSFALIDYWGYDDFPYIERISTFERNVDPSTGRARAGNLRDPCVASDSAGPLVFDIGTGDGPATSGSPASGRAIVGHDPGCLRPGPTDRTHFPAPFDAFPTRNENTFRASQARLDLANDPTAAGSFFIAPGDSRRNPRQTRGLADFDASLIKTDANGVALAPDGSPLPVESQWDARFVAPAFAAATLVNSNNSLDAHPANLQFFSFICAATVGFSALDPTACAQTVFGSTAVASEDNTGLGSLSRVLAQVLGGVPSASIFYNTLAGTIPPIVSLSRDSDTPVQFFRGSLTPGFAQSNSSQEGVVINRYCVVPGSPDCLAVGDQIGQRAGLDIVDVDQSVLDTLAGFAALQPIAIAADDPYGPTPRKRDSYFLGERANGFNDPSNPGGYGQPNNLNNPFHNAIWMGAREYLVPFYASCTFNDFRANLRNCDQNYEVEVGVADTLNDRLSAQQEALLGCGPFWGTNCDEEGIDLLNMDASVLLQAFPGLDGTTIPHGQAPLSSGGQWRTDGLEPGARVMALSQRGANAAPGNSFFAFSCAPGQAGTVVPTDCINGQINRDNFFEPIPTPGIFLTDDQLEAAGRPRRYSQPGTLPFVVQNARFTPGGDRLDYTCTTGDVGGRDSDILPGCRSKWKDFVGGNLNLFGLDHQCRQAAQAAVDAGGSLSDPRCIAGTPENRSVIESLTHITAYEKRALLERPRGGVFFGGDESFRADPRSWSVQIDGDPDRLGFDGYEAYSQQLGQRVRNEIVFRTPGTIWDSPNRRPGTPFAANLQGGAGHPLTGQPFANELAGFSWNFLQLIAATSGSFTNNLWDPDEAGASPINRPGVQFATGAPLAYSTYDPIDPDNAEFVARIADIDALIATLDPGDPVDLAQIRDLETERREQAAQTKSICSFITPQKCETVAALMGIAGQKRNVVAAGGNGAFGRRTFVWHGGGEILLKFNKRNVLGFSMDFAEDITKSNWGVEATWIQGIPTFDPNEFDNRTDTDTFNVTISVDRPTFINFLNPNRTFFITSQWFVQYRKGYHRQMAGNGPWNVLGIIAINTGYFQDRLLPSLLGVYDVMSASGAIIPQITYRFNENFSATVGLAGFWGRTERAVLPVNGIGPPGNRTLGDLQYNITVPTGLALVRERDEVFLRLRYTF